MIKNPKSSANDMVAVISKDIGMTAKILQLANSSFFGAVESVTNLSQAVVHLGFELVSRVVLIISMFEQSSHVVSSKVFLDKLWRESLLVGSLAGVIAAEEGCSQEVVDISTFAGLLQDIGKLVLAITLPEEYDQVLAKESDDFDHSLAREEKIVGTTHPVVGAYLAGLWGLPQEIVTIIAHHHDREWVRNANISHGFTPLTAVHLAVNIINTQETIEDYQSFTQMIKDHGFNPRLSMWSRLKEILDAKRSENESKDSICR